MDTLPRVPDVSKLSSRVIRILGQNGPSKFVLQGTNTYLVGTGRERVLIDTGEGKEAYLPLLAGVLKEEGCTITKVLLSHWHHDHVDGLPSVSALLRKNGSPAPEIWKFPHDSDGAAWLALQDADEVQVEGATLRAIHTPGHTTDHLSFHLLEDDVVFTADHILGGSTSVFEDLATYMSSLRKLQAVGADVLYPGHGLEIADGRRIVQGYIDHRQEREDQIVQVLRSKSGTPMDIVKVVYKDVREDLHMAAAHGVMQHLVKLQSEGRVSEEDEGIWKLSRASNI